MSQTVGGLVGRARTALVDRGSGAEAPAGDVHQPVAGDLVATLVIGIGGTAERRHELATKSGFLLDLAERRLLESLAAVHLALGKRPVIVSRAVDDGDPHRTA